MSESVELPFPRYTDFDPKVPVWCITPNAERSIHRFFDTSPISPSGRYVAITRFEQDMELPGPGDSASIVLIDLQQGSEKVIATTCGFEPQMGANISWGADDHALFFNDVVPGEWEPFAWKLDPITGDKQRMGGTLYQASPDGRWLASCSMTTMRRTQAGYGVIIPEQHIRRNIGLVDDDGLFITDTTTGDCRLLVSTRQVAQAAGPVELQECADDFEIYGFHTKWTPGRPEAPQGDRLILTLRWYPRDDQPQVASHMRQDLRFAVYTLKPDGSDIHLAIGPEHWKRRGHHINFCPDGRTLSANLNIDEPDGERRLRLVRCNHDGTGLEPMTTALLGSGHPSVHPCGKVLTDTYTQESTSFGDGTIPLRWIDPRKGSEECLVRINTAQPSPQSAWRVDPHPAWDRNWRWVAFNGYTDGARRVFIMDMARMLD
jgi:hypothetical protein